MEIFTTLSALLFTALIIIRCVCNRTAKKHTNQPPSPAKLPVIGNLHQIGLHPHRTLRSLSLHHGPLMLLHLGRVPVLITSTADAARDIMKTYDHAFASRPKSKLFHKLFYDHRDIAFSPYGEYWRQMKSISVVHLLSNKMVRSYRNIREEEISIMITRISQSVSTHSSINLTEIFSKFTNDVICRVALGRKYGDRKLKELLGKLAELLGGFNVGDYIPWLGWVDRINGLDYELEKVAERLDGFLEEVVKEHVERIDWRNGSNKALDFVDVLLSLQREKTAGFEIDMLSIKALILDVFAAGTDTTFTVLEWAMTELLRHPLVMAKLQEEVRTITGQRPYVSEDDLQKMNYLKSVFKETLRLHPPVPLLVPRESTQDVKIRGYDVASGTQVFVNAWAIGRDAATWGEDAEEFRPERFTNSELDFRGRNFELVPFGGGRRMCPGIAFATAVDEMALANLIHRFDWEVAGDIDVAESTGITIHRKFPLVASATHPNSLQFDATNAIKE